MVRLLLVCKILRADWVLYKFLKLFCETRYIQFRFQRCIKLCYCMSIESLQLSFSQEFASTSSFSEIIKRIITKPSNILNAMLKRSVFPRRTILLYLVVLKYYDKKKQLFLKWYQQSVLFISKLEATFMFAIETSEIIYSVM